MTVRGAAVVAALALALAAAAAAEPGGEVAAAPVQTDLVPTGPSVDERLADIARRVQAVLRYPAIARSRGLVGEALVEFRISSQGSPEAIRTRESSGSPLLDGAAERAVREAAPLPFVYGVVVVPVVFELARAPQGSD